MDAIFRSSTQTPVRPGARVCLEVKSREQLDQRPLDPTQVAMQILAASPQIDDRVTDQLSRPVIGRLATAVNREKRMRQMGSAPQTRLIRGASDGVDRLVLEKQQFVA